MTDVKWIVDPLNGDKLWYLDDALHRTDGPAVECLDGFKEWWIHGTYYEFDVWLKVTPLDDERKLLLKLQYG